MSRIRSFGVASFRSNLSIESEESLPWRKEVILVESRGMSSNRVLRISQRLPRVASSKDVPSRCSDVARSDLCLNPRLPR